MSYKCVVMVWNCVIFKKLDFSQSIRCFKSYRFLIRLRLLVGEKYLRSRRASTVWTATLKIKKYDNMLQNHIDSRVFVQDGHDFMRVEFSTHHRTDDHWRGRHLFDNPQIVCSEKIFEIPQSTSRLYPNTEKHEMN